MYAQGRIKANIAKYSQVGTLGGISGARVARELLDSQGLQGVAIESTLGMLSDHYDPRSKILRLSQQVYFAPTVAAAGIAAHEAGHAVQDAEDYFPLETTGRCGPLRRPLALARARYTLRGRPAARSEASAAIEARVWRSIFLRPTLACMTLFTAGSRLPATAAVGPRDDLQEMATGVLEITSRLSPVLLESFSHVGPTLNMAVGSFTTYEPPQAPHAPSLPGAR